MKVTLEQLAAEAGVSIATVSRVLNGSAPVAPETRLRVLETARRSGYSGNWKLAGRPLIAVVCSHFSDHYYYHALLYRILLEILDRNDFQYELIPVKHISLLAGRPVSGILLTVSRQSLPEEWQPEVPVVGINEEEDRAHNFYSIHSDLEGGFRRVVEEFYRLGHRRIALLIPGRDNYLDRNRERLFRLAAAALPGVEEKVVAGKEPVTVLGELRFQRVTALFAPSFNAQLPVYHALKLLNWKVPDEVSIVVHGTDNISRYLLPVPSELRADFETISREAVNTLKKLIAGEKVPASIKVPYQFIPGGSIAPPPAEAGTAAEKR